MDKNNGKIIFRIYNNDNCEIFIFRKGEEFTAINTQKNIILHLPFNLSDIFTVNISWRDWYNTGTDSPFSWEAYPKNVDTDTFSQIIITHYTTSNSTGENPCIIHIIGKI